MLTPSWRNGPPHPRPRRARRSISPGLTQRDNLENHSTWPNQYPETRRPKRENEKMRKWKMVGRCHKWKSCENWKMFFPIYPVGFLKRSVGHLQDLANKLYSFSKYFIVSCGWFPGYLFFSLVKWTSGPTASKDSRKRGQPTKIIQIHQSPWQRKRRKTMKN